MKQFEYKQTTRESEQLIKQGEVIYLNKEGKEGWELINKRQYHLGFIYLFKREIEQLTILSKSFIEGEDLKTILDRCKIVKE